MPGKPSIRSRSPTKAAGSSSALEHADAVLFEQINHAVAADEMRGADDDEAILVIVEQRLESRYPFAVACDEERLLKSGIAPDIRFQLGLEPARVAALPGMHHVAHLLGQIAGLFEARHQ